MDNLHRNPHHQRLCTALKCVDDGTRDIIKVWADRAEKLERRYYALRKANADLNAALIGLQDAHEAIHKLEAVIEA